MFVSLCNCLFIYLMTHKIHFSHQFYQGVPCTLTWINTRPARYKWGTLYHWAMLNPSEIDLFLCWGVVKQSFIPNVKQEVSSLSTISLVILLINQEIFHFLANLLFFSFLHYVYKMKQNHLLIVS